MRVPSNLMLALLSLSISSAFAGSTEISPAGGLRDSSGQPVLDGFGECWGTGFSRADAAACARFSQAATSRTAASTVTSSGESHSAHERGGRTTGSGAAAAYSRPAQEPISAKGNPGYVTDSNGFVVRGSQGECWHTSVWTPAAATVVGCDGVLAKAAPVPSPAPSPKPQAAPPAQVAPEPEAAPPLVTPSETPPAAVAPSTAPVPAAKSAPEARKAPPVVVPPSAPTAPSGLAPESGAAETSQPESRKITLDTDTYFDFDRATLKPAGERKLREIASRLSGMDLEVVVATGHTDWTGTREYNQGLSERRAAAVKRFLIGQGLPGGRIFTEGKGEQEPAASNHTREGRAKNRRVVVEVVGKPHR